MRLLITGISVLLFLNSFAQDNKVVSVVDIDGKPIEGVILLEKNGDYRTVSDEDGLLKIPGIIFERDKSWILSHISFEPLEVSSADFKSGKVRMKTSLTILKGIEVRATRADEDTPITYSNLSAEELDKLNFGQDLPILIEYTPSVVTTSDAGAGVGYTGMRIRGSDMTRINVTVNGIPLNDSESQGVFWVNTPDISSSLSSLQIQRGVGTSTNGAGAFGATVNLQTNEVNSKPYVNLNNAAGSFNTFKHTLELGTGLLPGSFSFDARLSKISSDGYIDRASSDLKSFYISGGYFGEKTTVKAVIFSGQERTYQSWWGTPEARIDNDIEGMNYVADINGYTEEQRQNLLNSGRTFNYYLYENEVDNYQQDHYQLHTSHSFSQNFNFHGALHYTYGRGYFEQFRNGEDFADYDLTPITTADGEINSSDLIRRRWLDNDFYGFTYNFEYIKNDMEIILGGAANRYDGAHFGEIIWAELMPGRSIRDRYYDNDAVKTDINSFLKLTKGFTNGLSVFGDIQYRYIGYETFGTDNDRLGGEPLPIDVNVTYNFLNPKAGIVYRDNEGLRSYLSFAVANREPIRSDFIDNQNLDTPLPETLRNLEMGLSKKFEKIKLDMNTYLMDYKNQLVLTGELNDVGASIRRNVDKSYRLGLETVAAWSLSEQFRIQGNLSLSRNKIQTFREIIYDYGVGWDEFNIVEREFSDTDIAFSPSVVGAGELVYSPAKTVSFSLLNKYVGKQFLDNTSNEERSLDPYFITDLIFQWSPQVNSFKNFDLGLQLNNLFNVLYEANGYTYGYIGGGNEIRENYLYPQAGTNFMVSLNIGL